MNAEQPPKTPTPSSTSTPALSGDAGDALAAGSGQALSADGSPVPIAWVEDLFKRLTAIVGSGMFSTVYAGADPQTVKEQWAEALAGFTAAEIKRGLAAARTAKFPPNLPEFLHLCRPALDPEVAWDEAAAGLKAHAEGERYAWSHPAVYWAARAMQYEVRTTPFGQMRKRWAAVLAEEFAKGYWASPPDPTVKAIAKAEQKPLPPEVVASRHAQQQEMLKDLRQKLTGFRTPADERAAREALERELDAQAERAP